MSENKIGYVLLQSLSWGIVGAVYAGLFAALWTVFDFQGMGKYAFLLSSALAGIAGAAVYGAMQIALIATLTGIISVTAYMLAVSRHVGLWEAVLAAAIAGAVTGAVLRFPSQFTRGIPAKAVAGLVAGAIAGVVVILYKRMFPTYSDISILAGLLVIATGILYVGFVKWWVDRLEKLCPRIILDSLSAATVSAVVGGSVWILGGPVVGAVGPGHKELLDTVSSLLPVAMVGGAVAGAVCGALLELFGFKPQL